MAFHQPTRQLTQRLVRRAVEEEEVAEQEEAYAAPAVVDGHISELQTWVLFAPPTDGGTTASYLSESQAGRSTPGRSRLSDIGSLHSAAQSRPSGNLHFLHPVDRLDEHNEDAEEEEEDEEDQEGEEDDAELDSLDSHLPEFRSAPHMPQSSLLQGHATPVVPAHNGLGSFRFDPGGMGPDAQDRLYAFEQYNPRRVKRRRESLEAGQAELDRDRDRGPGQEVDKMRRIEAWRLEQSRLLLQDIQRETRRRSFATGPGIGEQGVDGIAAWTAHVEDSDRDEAWHDREASEPGGEGESVWRRMSRRVMCDLLGIDDKLLSFLFGHSLPDDAELSTSTTPTAPEDSAWQIRVLEGVASELGLLVHHLSEHPGAFSTYTRSQQMHISYAGLPPIPETTNDAQLELEAKPVGTVDLPDFQPTIRPQSRPVDAAIAANLNTAPTQQQQKQQKQQQQQQQQQQQLGSGAATFTQEEWEQDLDVRLVFRYLTSRFLSRPSSSSTGGLSGGSGARGATCTADAAAAKAARVRQHHPLVSNRARPTGERRAFKPASASPSAQMHHYHRHASSCASQSTRRSLRRSSGSSRHYWDVGGAPSVGTGSLIAATGPLGSWGEV